MIESMSLEIRNVPLLIIQARMESTRFPGKVLAPIMGQPMLLFQLDRLRALEDFVDIVVACPDTQASHDTLKPLLERHGYAAWVPPGIDQNDVLGRYTAVIEKRGIIKNQRYDPIIRMTGDCPLIDASVVFKLLELYEEDRVYSQKNDYVALSQEWPDGLDVEIVSYDTLKQVHEEATAHADREHVTPYIWRNQKRFVQMTLPCPFNLSQHCWSVDTKYDRVMVEQVVLRVIAEHGCAFGWRDVYSTMQHHKRFLDWATSRKRNEAYMQQVAPDKSWNDVRYTDDA